MYIIPQPVKCPKCGYEAFDNPNYPKLLDGYCPECLRKFLDDHVPMMIPDKESGRKFEEKWTPILG